MDQKNQLEILYRDECLDLLASQRVGRIAFVAEDGAMILPINYVLHDDRIVFRTNSGSKYSAVLGAEKVAFEIDGIDPVQATGWSVVVRGRARLLSAKVRLDPSERGDLRPWARGARDHWVALSLETVTGRRIRTAAEDRQRRRKP